MGSKPPKVPWQRDQNRQLLGPQPGQQAQAIVPKVVEQYVPRKGKIPNEAVTLAAIGPSAKKNMHLPETPGAKCPRSWLDS